MVIVMDFLMDKLLKSENEKINLEASRDVTKITGIMPTNTVNQFLVNINQTNITSINPEMEALRQHVSGGLFGDDEVQEAEVQDDE